MREGGEPDRVQPEQPGLHVDTGSPGTSGTGSQASPPPAARTLAGTEACVLRVVSSLAKAGFWASIKRLEPQSQGGAPGAPRVPAFQLT